MVVRAGTVGAALVLALMSLVLIAGTSSAEIKQSRELAKQRAKAQSFDKAVVLMEKHMSEASDGTIELDEAGLKADIDAGAAAGVDRSVFEELQGALENTNNNLETGEMEASEVFPSSATERLASGDMYTAARCAGVNSLHTHWYGWHVLMNDCRTHTFSWGLKAGWTAGQIRALLGRNLPVAIAMTLGNFASSTVDYIDARGGHRGIQTKITWNSYVFYYWHQ